MGYVHSRSYRQIGVRFADSGLIPRLVVCADDVESRAREAQRILGFERCATDWQAVIDDPEVEAVNIAAPNRYHLDMVRAAAAAGKAVFCEKPVGRTPRETAAIAAAARHAGLLTGVGYNYRWTPVVQYARQLIREGKLGRLTHYRGRFFAGYASNPDGVLSWRFDREEAGLGALGDLMSHVADMAHMIAGPVERVVGQRATFILERPEATPGVGTHFSVSAGGPKAPVTNEDYAGALAQFSCGAFGTLEVCRVIQGPKCEMAFEVHGTEGALSWTFERMNEMRLFMATDDDTRDGYTTIMGNPVHPFHARFNPGPGVGLGYDDLKVIEAHQFLQTVASGEQGEPGFSEALAVAGVLSAIERSWDSGKWEDVREVEP
jgi:predicted dehydrogenase